MNKLTKKFVSLLTVVAFLLTLVPAAAFAAGETVAVQGKLQEGATTVNVNLTNVTEAGKVLIKVGPNSADLIGEADVKAGETTKAVTVKALVKDQTVTATLTDATKARVLAEDTKGVKVEAKDTTPAPAPTPEPEKTDLKKVSPEIELTQFEANASANREYTGELVVPEGTKLAKGTKVYFVAKKDGDETTKFEIVKGQAFDTVATQGKIYAATLKEDVDATKKDTAVKFTYKFTEAGKYTIYAGLVLDAKGEKIDADYDFINSPVAVTVEPELVVAGKVVVKSTDYRDEATKTFMVDPNGVTETPVTVTFYKEDGKTPVGKDYEVKVSVSNKGILVNGKTEDVLKTDARGRVKVNLTGTLEGEYKVYFDYRTIDNKADVYEVKALVRPLRAENFVDVESPEHPLAYGDYVDGQLNFSIVDRTGQIIKADFLKAGTYGLGFDGLLDQLGLKRGTTLQGPIYGVKYEGNFVNVVKAPATANLRDSNLAIVYNGDGTYSLNVNKVLPVGDYEFEVKLDNGATATFKFSVAKFTKAKELKLEYPAQSIELGGTSKAAKVYFVDENGVQKDAAKYVSLGAVGYAIKDFNSKTGVVRVSNDEKYLGSTIKVTAVAARENLYADATLTVTDGKGGDNTLAFDKKAGAVGQNNRVKVSVVDSKGNKVYLGDSYTIKSASAIVTNQSNKDAKIQTNVSELGTKKDGNAILNLMSDKAGSADVMVTLVAEHDKKAAFFNSNQSGNETIFYRGTLHFVFGGNGVNTVVMNIGSLDVIAGDKVVKIDTAPFVKENRTFVPVRALAEAFGAEVKYEDKDKTITITEGGKTVVMTLDSKEYTVNGEKKTLDVAPFVATGNRTVLPIRFAAEALGYTVTPTYSTVNGATVSVVFVR